MQGFVMMALGAYRFAVTTAGMDKIERTRKWRWASLDVIGAPPVKQFTGPGEDEVSIEGVIFPHFAGGVRQVDAMSSQAGTGQPLNLVDGMGRYWGRFAITEAKETRSVLMSDGAPRKIDFTINLTRVE